jgi:AraC family transcriptional regulator of adaptative response/methylated-DNA-[protein]-cysteine methyltransferase
MVDLVADMCRHIEEHAEETLPLAELARQAGMSAGHFQRLFKRVVGVSPRQYQDACRMRLLRENLKDQATVTESLYAAGFGSSSRLYERSDASLGMTPGEYRNGAGGKTIRYATLGCPLGRLLVAGTDRGVAAVSLGDEDDPLVDFLKEEFPRAQLERDDVKLATWTAALLAYLEGQSPHLELPLDVQATAFQRRVWQELCKIPYGETATYSEIARRLGQPTAARAVARACATNPASLVIPCHRVVREDGHLGGYRWGLGRKEELLRLESGEDAEPSGA